MDANEIRDEALGDFNNSDTAIFFMLRELTAQLAETNALLRSLVETNAKGEGKLRVRTLQY